MKRLERLAAIHFQLQANILLTSRRIAEKYSISQRTVYRDIKALIAAGVPIIGEPGTGYSLMQGYRLPPIMFTQDEINALITAQKLIQIQTDSSLTDYYNQALKKIQAVLQYSCKEKTEKLQKRILNLSSAVEGRTTPYLITIQSAIITTKVLRINYQAFSSKNYTCRDIEPLALYYTANNWVLIAYCRLRREYREFRLDRIIRVQETSHHFSEKIFLFDSYISSKK